MRDVPRSKTIRRLALLAACAWTLGLPGPHAAETPEAAGFEAYAKARVAAVQADLDAARPGYVLVLGDSNAQRAPTAAVDCGAGVVNAGIGGVRAGQYLALIGNLRLRNGGAAAILNVGTGDIWRGLDPLAPDSVAAYEGAMERLLRLAGAHVGQVVVSALPPLSGRPATKLDPAAVETYSQRLRALCGRLGCIYADPWAAMRSEAFGLARPGTSIDGIHPDDPVAPFASRGKAHCRGRTSAARLR